MPHDLPAAAPGFDQPIAVLKHCHDRIRKQLDTLQRLPAHLAAHGADEQARQAAQAIINYFEKAAHLHHADEEENLLPVLRLVATARTRPPSMRWGPASWPTTKPCTPCGSTCTNN